MKSKILLAALVTLLVGYVYFAFFSKPDPFPAKPAVPSLTPAEQLKTFVLPEGYRLELVVSDPIIKEPVATVFDGDGRMFVAEMRSYMQDVEGSHQRTNTSRISMHWSSKNDGVFDQHSVFADNLLLPRMMLPLADGLLVGETDSDDLWLYRDTNDDGVADVKTRLYAGENKNRGGHIEHQSSGLIWNLDNWIYITACDYRLRLDGTNVIKETISVNGGQWGLSHDDYGKPWFINAKGDLGPMHFQQPFYYGRFTIKDEVAAGFREVWPLVNIPDVEGGSQRFRAKEKTLNHFTATCGGEIFRGDRLPNDLRGDLLFAEPVGRLIRRAKIEVRDGVTYLRNAYEQSEFIRSSDPNFRPVNMTTAPDGTLYITDMYRGVIQEGNWVKEGSYLRNVIKQYQLDKNVGRGRIWRLVHDGFKPGEAPRLQDAEPAELLKNLEHPNGWRRDTAQKLLVLRRDTSVVPELKVMLSGHSNHLSRIHALWTLEGLGLIDPAIVREALKDEHPQVRIAAIRASETLLKKGDDSLASAILNIAEDPDPNVAIQALLTADFLKWKEANQLINETMQKNPAKGVQEIGTQLLIPDISAGREFSEAEKQLLRRGGNIYGELCFACHGPDGEGVILAGATEKEATMAPPLARSKTVTGLSDMVLHVLLKGLTGPIDGKRYPADMMSVESYEDESIAAVASYIRNSFGNNASLIEAHDVARLRATFRERRAPWTLEEIRGVIPQYLGNRTQWKVTASHNESLAAQAIDNYPVTRYDTKMAQTPGMWFKIELPQESLISGLFLNASTSLQTYPREFVVELSRDGKEWDEPIVKERGNANTTEVSFSPQNARFIRITLTAEAQGVVWSIHDLQLLQPPDPSKVAAAQSKKTKASSFE